jgi:nitroreductase
MNFKELVQKRQSIRKYSYKKPTWRKIIQALDYARFAPSAGNQYSMKFILVSDENKIAKITKASQQQYVGTVKFLVVAVSDESKLVRSYGERGKRYCSLQAGASIQNFLLALTELGMATTWVGHFYDEQVKEILNIPDDNIIEGIFPIGIETKIKTPKRPKQELENILYFDSWKNKKMVPETKTFS